MSLRAVSENRLDFRRFDEWMLETLIEEDIDFPWVCAGCRQRCAKTETCNGKSFEALDCDWLVLVDRRNYRPICKTCFATFGQPRSTAEGIFGL